MFELAHRLVGIYKTSNCTKSIAIDNKDLKTQAQPVRKGIMRPPASVLPRSGSNGSTSSGLLTPTAARQAGTVGWAGSPAPSQSQSQSQARRLSATPSLSHLVPPGTMESLGTGSPIKSRRRSLLQVPGLERTSSSEGEMPGTPTTVKG